jgi:hypothetical protein
MSDIVALSHPVYTGPAVFAATDLRGDVTTEDGYTRKKRRGPNDGEFAVKTGHISELR